MPIYVYEIIRDGEDRGSALVGYHATLGPRIRERRALSSAILSSPFPRNPVSASALCDLLGNLQACDLHVEILKLKES